MPTGNPANRLSTARLHQWVDASLRSSHFSVLSLPDERPKPFFYAISDDLMEPVVVRVYAWNATHGGGSARADDEYRIQLTGLMPERVDGELTVILGWSEDHEVFVGWDPRVHDRRESASPSLQVREDVMNRAARDGIAPGFRASGDVVIAFRPELLGAYCLSVHEVHDDPDSATFEWLDTISSPVHVMAPPRRTVDRRLEFAYRAWDFSDRVRKAYDFRCSLCGLGLGLVEGAHIVPVAWEGSTDETRNGLAMCRNHHAAYDLSLISVAPDLTIEVSEERLSKVAAEISNYDVQWLDDLDGSTLRALPRRREDRPDPKYLELGRTVRRWGT